MGYYEMLEQFANQDRAFWDYYKMYDTDVIRTCFQDPEWFIEKTFMYAAKKSLIVTNEDDDTQPRHHISATRAAHSASTFFFGAYLAKNLFDGKFFGLTVASEDCYPDEYFKFSYIWTLTSLYHDFGYLWEQDADKASRPSYDVTRWYHGTRSMQKISRIIVESEIPSNLPVQQFRRCRGNVIPVNHLEQNAEQKIQCKSLQYQYFHKMSVHNTADYRQIRFPIRGRGILDRYLAYRLLKLEAFSNYPKIDHGIVGGHLFHSNILKAYAKAYLLEREYDKSVNLYDFETRYGSGETMRFSTMQLPIFKYIADCIENHNIWSAQEETTSAEIYRRFGLDSLIGKRYQKIRFSDNPLLFILAVVDSLEPYKLLSDTPIDEQEYSFEGFQKAVRKINFEVHSNEIRISVPAKKRKLLQKRILGMTEWIDITFEHNDTHTVIYVQ